MSTLANLPAFGILAGLVLLLIGAEAVLRGTLGVARRFNVPEQAVGFLVVGLGTSLPELTVAIDAVVQGVPELAAGNALGANFVNLLVVLPVAAFARTIVRPSPHVRREGAILGAAVALLAAFAASGTIAGWQGGAMIAAFAVAAAGIFLWPETQSIKPPVLNPPIPLPKEVSPRLGLSLILVAAGLGSLIYGAELLVDGAVALARVWGVTEGMIGLSVVSLGSTSPELVSAILAVRKGRPRLAYSNLLGSFLFNLLVVLGVAAQFGPLSVPMLMLWMDVPVLLLALVLVFAALSSKTGLTQRRAAGFVCLYTLYLAGRYSYIIQ